VSILRTTSVISLSCLVAFACGGDDGNSTGPDPTGSIEVALTMSGESLDADGCVFTVDGASSRRITDGESTTYTSLAVGQHEVVISDVAGNCQVLGEMARSLAVVRDQIAAVTYAVTCAQDVGAIEVTTETSGDDPDADGYQVVVDGGPPAAIGINGLMTVGGLTSGDHTVALEDVASNCSVAGGNPRTVEVAAGQTAHAVFAVTCSSVAGSIAISASTSGDDLDGDGYEVVLDGGTPTSIGINGSMTAGGLSPGDYTVELQNLAFNCSVDGANPRQVTVTMGAVTQAVFDVTCRYHLYNRIVFQSWRTGSAILHAVDPQNPGVVRSLDILGEHPAVTKDGLRITFDWGLDIWVADSDGGNAVNLTQSIDGEQFSIWSPDGSRIVFRRGIGLWVMNADGSDQSYLGIDGWKPTWSPDGTRIAYMSIGGGTDLEIWVINADGSGSPINVSNDPAWDAYPAWSPLGNYIAFSSTRNGTPHIYVVDPGGGPVTPMTTSLISSAMYPTWAPEAAAGAFQSDAAGNDDIYYFDPNGGGPVQLTTSSAQDLQPFWGGGN
jgi:TolB protein